MKGEGERLRDEGLERVGAGCAAWIARAREAGLLLALRNGIVTSDDVDEVCKRPEDVNPNAAGAVLRAPLFRAVGMRKTQRPSGHARRILEWSLTEQGQQEARRVAGVREPEQGRLFR